MKLSYAILFGLFGVSAIALPTQAQITIDGTTNTILDNNGNSIIINGGDRAGDNLFHSFQEFSVNNGGEAYFNNAVDISNIFSRVTGGNISNIDGLLRANGGANLFIINPAGIVFGEGASLNIGGSFFATTADSIIFSDGIEFSALEGDNPPLLTINQPIGLVLGNNAGAIVNQSVADDVGLQVSPGNNLTLVGGDIEFNSGTIFAPGANVELGGLSVAGEININADGSLSFPEDIARADVTLTNGTNINVQSEGGGNISINANNIELSSGELGFSSLFAGIAPDSGSTETQAGDIVLDATGNTNITKGSIIGNSIEDFGVGNSGNIEINADNINITEGGYIFANVYGQGNAGDIILKASNTINMSGEEANGFPSAVENRIITEEQSNGGNIEIAATNLIIIEGSYLSASVFGTGNGGSITIDVLDTITITGEDSSGFSSYITGQVSSETKGSTGDIEINTTDLFLTDGGFISTDIFGTGNAGAITINASDTIALSGENSSGFPSSISSFISSEGEGNSGNITITATNLSLIEGGYIFTTITGTGDAGSIAVNVSDTITVTGEDSFGLASYITSQVLEGEGNAGDISISAANLFVTQGAFISTETFAIGDAGTITIDVTDTITVTGEDSFGLASSIASRVLEGEGNAGNVEITTTNLSLTEGSFIASDTSDNALGNAGNIIIKALDTITLSGEGSSGVPSGIITRVFRGEGNAGIIDITTANLSLTDGASISTTTTGIGDAGEIIIKASDTINISGEDSLGLPSGIFSQVEEEAVGEASGIEIFTDNLLLTNGAEISVDSQGEASAGDLFIQANSLSLDDSSLTASTPVGTGGNITLEIAESLILRNNSLISANALNDANGGNVVIDADAIVAFPNQNNDIIAAAEQGDGGEIDITTSAIFGIAERSSIPENNTNDLDASSEFGIDGTISINELDVNPAEGLEELPTDVIDVASLVAQNLCQQGEGSEFILTGKGGIAASPSQTRDSNLSEVDLVEPVLEEAGEQSFGFAQDTESREAEKEIVEAQGWVVNSRGVLELVAHSTDAVGSPPQPKYDKVCPK